MTPAPDIRALAEHPLVGSQVAQSYIEFTRRDQRKTPLREVFLILGKKEVEDE